LTGGPAAADGSVAAALSSSLESTQPLSELVDPLLRKIQEGLGDMSKVVGSSTPVPDATPDQLAVALELFRRSDEGLALPLLELKRVVSRRRRRLHEVAARQLEQIASLARSVAVLRSGLSALADTMDRIEARGATLSQRSSAALLAGQALVPTVSRAEHEYFQDVKRIGNKTASLEHRAQRAAESAETVRAKLRARPLALSLTEPQRKAVAAMLDEQASTLAQTRSTMDQAQARLTDLAASLNLQ
jgi:chromosome segregation ATPase